jgi:hypothetical protein
MMIANRAVLLAILVSAGTVVAQPGDTVGAEALFREGKRLMKDGKTAEACDKLAASEHLDRSIGTLLNLADCREKNHQLATAWATFLEAASAARGAGDPTREAEARKRASALEAHLAYLTISVPDASKVEGLVIKRGDLVVDPALWNQGVPIDTGAYEISGQAPGHEPWSTRVQINVEAQRASVEVPRFKQLADMTKAVAKLEAAKSAAPEQSDDEAGEPPVVEHHTFTTLRYASVTSAAVGVLALTGGIVIALEARDLQHRSDAICPDTACNDTHGLDLNSRARSDMTTSEILFGVGGAAIAGAAVMWFVGAPAATGERVSVIPNVTASHAGLAVVGRF